MADSRRQFCGFLFWSKAFLALLIVCGLLGFESWQVYTLRVQGLKNQKAKDDFSKLVGGPDVGQGSKITIDPTNTQCLGDTPSFTNVTGSAATGLNHAISSGNRVEPPAGVKLFGFAVDFSFDTPAKIATRLGGRNPSVIAAFLTILGDFVIDENMINWFAQQTGLVNGILELTIVPNVTLDTLPDKFYNNLTDILYRVNQRHACPVILRYAHEMNGNWNYYGQRPTAYIASWRKLATLLRQKTNMTALMWAPNPGSGYPYGTVAKTAVDFSILDSNKDGVIDVTDDPYGPYWPGAQYVDWIGISMYNYNYNDTLAQYSNVASTYIQEQLSGPWTGVTTSPYQNFYARFVDTYAKPFAFPESGSPYVPNAVGYTIAAEVANKRVWWNQIFNFFTDQTLYPNLKLVVNFEETKYENAGNTFATKDFTLTNKTAVASAFLTDMGTLDRSTNAKGTLTWANYLNYTCGGKIVVK
ncbi:hypothetical protein HK096_009486 [Nowakowskiella sp. JEL0078]|nr:hypothetical protein HK096_009486 [Nowakowskiella sp. JEL0078]